MQSFSIVIPLYNEEQRIPKTIREILDFFAPNPDFSPEIIFVNDGSTDATLAVLDSYRASGPFTVVTYAENRGKGYAVRTGVAASSGDRIVFFDIDLATPLSEFTALRRSLGPDDGIVIGSRRLGASRIVKSQSGIRMFLGHQFTKLSNLLVPGVTDFTCGFKCFSRAAADIIFPRARIDRWAFDTELLYIAKLHAIPVREMPVAWRHDDDSRVSVVRAAWDSMRELVRMKAYQLRGLYL